MCLAFNLLFTAPTHATTPSQTHMLVLKCANSESTTFLSRLAVLDIPQSKKMDFALVTGHALPLERPCFVQDFEGNQRDVDLIDYAKAFEVGTPNDWALISFRKMKTKNLVLVGLHIGRAWFFKSPYTGRADRHGYVALFDPNMVEEINTILSTKVSRF